MVSFVLSFFPRDVLDEILRLESVSKGSPTNSFKAVLLKLQQIIKVKLASFDAQNLSHRSYLPLPIRMYNIMKNVYKIRVQSIFC